jgi:hypothetical protein
MPLNDPVALPQLAARHARDLRRAVRPLHPGGTPGEARRRRSVARTRWWGRAVLERARSR